MGRSSRPKEKYEKGGELPQHDSHEGTSARTRPFSYDEIMFKRNSKKVNENAESVKEGNTEVGRIAKERPIQKDINVKKSEGRHRHSKDFSRGHEKHLLDELEKSTSHKKVENASRRNDSMSKQKNGENHGSERRLKSEVRKDMGVKDEGEYEKQIHVRTKNERPAGGSENIDAKKHSRDIVERYRHAGRIKGKSERDIKRKHQTRDGEQNRKRNTTKKHDIRKGQASESSEKKEKKESSRSHYEESHHKRRRSQSRECEDRHGRSISFSPRAHKRASHHVSEHEQFLHGVKGRTGRQHSDDRSRMTNNGSSGHHRRHGVSTSGLGGYSPRKRKTEAAVRTPSPAHRSTEKRTAKWDLAPAETEKIVSGSVSSNLQASSQTISLNMHAVFNAVPSVSITRKPLVVASPSSLSSKHTVSFDSVQLTEATRPMRRLYVENVPASASEKAIMASFNNFLLSSGINHIQGTQPCISCIIHKGKGQALVEFLTPEDASAALSFDGSTFSGSILKIRRPKDFVEVTGEPQKSEATVTTVSDIVKDSHHKIFIGGISKALSPEMLVEIAKAFGPLKAYHFEINEDLSEQYAILEFPDDLSSLSEAEVEEVLEDVRLECSRFGTIKSANVVKHANSIITTGDNKMDDNTRETGTRQNLEDDEINVEKETMEEVTDGNSGGTAGIKFPSDSHDVMACSSYDDEKLVGNLLDNELCPQVEFEGNINSEDINQGSLDAEPCQLEGLDSNSAGGAQIDTEIAVEDQALETADKTVSQRVANSVNTSKEESDYHSDGNADNIQSDATNFGKILAAEENSNLEEVNGELPEGHTELAVEDPITMSVSVTISQQIPMLLNTSKEKPDSQYEKIADNTQSAVIKVEKKLVSKEDLQQEEANGKLLEAVDGSTGSVRMESDTIDEDENSKENNLKQIFEPGCVFVEYRRIEASCMAAHCIHGRLFDDRIVTVEYIDPDLYRVKFPK
ncbi:uncharacterized protein LOC111306738 isoform X2 [Durio zibethinus]|uniref:Uncharacterized protein LOC111306738 isoform X2 n=1 Tax=Durio zibethinus TaxID=66656 RepID=A0A6P6A5S5_DURZI|nr:uncharacterized protein LOC111306738 isoform X2 [Durio zibethinus]